MSELQRVEIPDSAKQSLRLLLAQKQQTEQLINTYIQALRDSLDIQGDGWAIQLVDMVFVQQSPNGKVDTDVLGAIAGNNTRE
jgi:hypothetical protein